MRIAKILNDLTNDLEKIESQLYKAVKSNHPIIQNSSKQLLQAGGKRIRPLFVLICSRLGEEKLDEDIIRTAVTIELIHMATLVHDDVIDHASLRRGKPTVRKQYDNRIAMYIGDYLLACALEKMTEIKKPSLHKLLAKTIVEVCLGEVNQVKEKFDWNQNVRTYLRRIKRKTAILIACCCKLGALLAGLTKEKAESLYKYGYYVGMSYQIIDDILDFTSTEKDLGKPVGNDLRQGNITYPVLVAMEDKQFSEKIKDVFSKDNDISQERLNNLIDDMKRLKAFEKSYRLSKKYLQKALYELNKLPRSKTKTILVQLAYKLGKRNA